MFDFWFRHRTINGFEMDLGEPLSSVLNIKCEKHDKKEMQQLAMGSDGANDAWVQFTMSELSARRGGRGR